MLAAVQDRARQLRDALILQWFAAADGHHGCVALLHRRQALLHAERRPALRGHLPIFAVRTAAGAHTAAQRVQREHDGEFPPAAQFVLREMFGGIEDQPEGIPHCFA